MWDRKELKQRARASLNANYWKSVLAALIFTVITGSGAVASGSAVDGGGAAQPMDVRAALAALAVIEVGMLTVSLIGVLVQIFLLYPLEVGCQKYFLGASGENGELRDIAHGFRSGYPRNCGILFLRTLFLILWGCLFVIPGIVKAYEYRMVPFILAEDSEVTGKEAFAISKEMMRGNKWDAFVLDISFLGWYLFVGITGGLAGVFYVFPYVCHTNAELYYELRDSR